MIIHYTLASIALTDSTYQTQYAMEIFSTLWKIEYQFSFDLLATHVTMANDSLIHHYVMLYYPFPCSLEKVTPARMELVINLALNKCMTHKLTNFC